MNVGLPVLVAGLARNDLDNEEQQLKDLHEAVKLKRKTAKWL